jgi:uncharacterized membrane protein
MQFEPDLISRFWIPILFMILSIPLILNKIRPNHILGVRIKETFSNKGIWYKANQILGWHLLIIGSILVVYRTVEPYIHFLKGNFKGAISILFILSMISLSIFMKKTK